MGFQHGLSGLNAASKNLDVVGNNIANSSTVGFKASRIQFSDVYANSLTGSGGSQVGIGVQVAGIAQQFTQGNVTSTENPLDIAINGGGFFRVSDNGTIAYTRNGQFKLKDGYILTPNGERLTGYIADSTGTLSTGAPTDLVISSADLAPVATSQVDAQLTLDSTSSNIAAAFDPTDPATFTHATSLEIYDSLGNSHVLQMYFRKTAANTWDVQAITDPDAYAANSATGFGSIGTLTFTTSGQINTATTTFPSNVNMTVNTGAVSPLTFAMDFTGTAQYGTAFSVGDLDQNGYTSGRLTSFNVAADGMIVGRYSNGKSATLGQVVLAGFDSPEGLEPIGNNLWSETASSGPALVSTPDSGSLGVLKSNAIEESNVDLTKELVNMITAQRLYEANSQTIKTQDQVMQTLVNLR